MSDDNKVVCKCNRRVKVSSKGKPYEVLEVHFPNSYILTTFISDEQKFILKDVPLVVE